MPIKHLVFCGGAHSVCRTVGALYELEEKHVWKRENIQTIYGTSAGGMLGVCVCLGFDKKTLQDYMIERKWHKSFKLSAEQFLDAFVTKGILGNDFSEIIFKPLLFAKGLSLQVTMKELYEFSNIELHMFTLELNNYVLEDISYKSHPDLPVLDAILMTSAVTPLIAPVIKDGKCYVDGGFMSNYPLQYCLDHGHKKEEILGFRFSYFDEEPYPVKEAVLGEEHAHEDNSTNSKKMVRTLNLSNPITPESNIFDFMINFIIRNVIYIGTEFKQPEIPYEVVCDTRMLSFEIFSTFVKTRDYRKLMIDSGIYYANEFLKYNPNCIQELNAYGCNEEEDVVNDEDEELVKEEEPHPRIEEKAMDLDNNHL
jgi:predicted acylesterase/phospholipase RssA